MLFVNYECPETGAEHLSPIGIPRDKLVEGARAPFYNEKMRSRDRGATGLVKKRVRSQSRDEKGIGRHLSQRDLLTGQRTRTAVQALYSTA
jgi:hypothetical protein